jgi:hypothetical protein
MPAAKSASDSCLLVSLVKLSVAWRFLVIALFRAGPRASGRFCAVTPAGPAASVTTAVCRLPPGATQASATWLPGR